MPPPDDPFAPDYWSWCGGINYHQRLLRTKLREETRYIVNGVEMAWWEADLALWRLRLEDPLTDDKWTMSGA